MLHGQRPMVGSVPSPTVIPPGSIAAMVRALPAGTQPNAAFRDAACAALRMTRERGRIECDALGAVFEDEQTSDDRRSLVLDLLANAGTPEAQIVMRRLLALGVARRNSRTFASFVQRLGFMERPDGATLRFLISVYAESKNELHEVRAACAYALGAGAGRAHVWGLTDAAIRASEVLRHDLLRATQTSEKCALIAALGNAGLESDVGVILRFVDDAESRVRGAAALALKKMHTTEARISLLGLLTSSDDYVAESALSALFEQSLAHDEIVRLAELVLAGRTSLSLDGRVLRLIVTQKLHVVGKAPLETVEDAIHLLLSRIEAHALRAGGVGISRSHVEGENHSGYARRSSIPSQAPLPPPPHGSHLSRSSIPLPKTPLPYSAGYRLVSHTESNRISDTFDDAKLAAMGVSLPPGAVASSGAVAPSGAGRPSTLVQPSASSPPASAAPVGTPTRRSRSPEMQRTLMHGSISSALRLTAGRPADASASEPVESAPPSSSSGPRTPPTTPSLQRIDTEIRSMSAVSVACPIVPLAIIR